MERGKDRAIVNRNRGIPTGKAAAGHTRRRRLPSLSLEDRREIEARIRAKVEAEIAAEDTLRAAYPERYEFFV